MSEPADRTLQLRQGYVADRTWDGHKSREQDLAVRWGEWHDVPNPAYLWGYLLPHIEVVYEFRWKPEPDVSEDIAPPL